MAEAVGADAPGGAAADALADVLSAAFDRAALAVSSGAPEEPYREAVRLLLGRLRG